MNLLYALLASIVAMAMGCTVPKEKMPAREPADVTESAADPSILYTGCTQMRPGPVCLVPQNVPISLWRPLGTQKAVTWVVRFAGEVLKTEIIPVDGGERYTARLRGTRSGRLQFGPPHSPARFVLEIRPTVAPPDVLNRAAQLHNDGGDAEALLEAALQNSEQDAVLLSRLGRMARDRGAYRLALTYLGKAAAHYKRTGDAYRQAADSVVAAYIHIQHLRDFKAARRLLGDLSDLGQGLNSQGRVLWWRHYFSGLLASEVGDHRQTQIEASKAVRVARRLGMIALLGVAEQLLAHTFQQTGDVNAALRLLSSAWNSAHKEGNACAERHALNNYAWTLLQASEGRVLRLNKDALSPDLGAQPTPLFERALALKCPTDVQEKSNLAINLALSALQSGDRTQALVWLEQAKSLGAEGQFSLWAQEIAARLMPPSQSFVAFDVLEHTAVQAANADMQWRALLGMARARLAQGETHAAYALFEKAETLVTQERLSVPVHAGRSGFLQWRSAATQDYVQALLEEGEVYKAFAVVRRSHRQLLGDLSFAQRVHSLRADKRALWDSHMSDYRRLRDVLQNLTAESWQVHPERRKVAAVKRATAAGRVRAALDRALGVLNLDVEHNYTEKPLEEGIVELTYFPLARGIGAFVRSGAGVRGELLNAISSHDGRALSRQLLGPFAASIATASRVRIVGALPGIDFHALPFRGAPLLVHAEVVYALGLGQQPPVEESVRGTALVVVDPGGNLPDARREGDMVAAAVGANTKVLRGAGATGVAVREGLGRARLFHYAGHSVVDGSPLHDAYRVTDWRARITLADGPLNVDDILTLPHIPSVVVLSSCNSGAPSPAHAGTIHENLVGLSLAEAFVLRGARRVVATQRPVSDALAWRVAKALYATRGTSLGRINIMNGPGSLRYAALAARAQSPESDWASFREYVP